MRISDVSSSYTLLNQLQSLASEEVDIEEELVSGKSVDELSDDAALGETLLNSQVDMERLIQYNENANTADSIAQAGIDSLDYINDEIDLALSVADSASEDGTDLSSSIDDIISEILATANGTYGDDYLFAGSASGSSTEPYTYDEDTGTYVYNGADDDGREIQVSDGVTISPFTDSEGTTAILDTLNALVSLKNAIASGDADAIDTATDALSTAQDDIVDSSSELGTTQARIELIADSNSSRYTTLDDAEENATNADTEESTVKLLAAQNAYSAALQGAALLLDETILDYL